MTSTANYKVTLWRYNKDKRVGVGSHSIKVTKANDTVSETLCLTLQQDKNLKIAVRLQTSILRSLGGVSHTRPTCHVISPNTHIPAPYGI